MWPPVITNTCTVYARRQRHPHLLIMREFAGDLQDRVTVRADCRRRRSSRSPRRRRLGHRGRQDGADEHGQTSPAGRCSSWKERFPSVIIQTSSFASRLQHNFSSLKLVYRLDSFNCHRQRPIYYPEKVAPAWTRM